MAPGHGPLVNIMALRSPDFVNANSVSQVVSLKTHIHVLSYKEEVVLVDASAVGVWYTRVSLECSLTQGTFSSPTTSTRDSLVWSCSIQ